LEIVSFLYLVEIRVYTVAARHNVLNCSALNKNFSKSARLLKNKDNHFDVLFEDQTFSNLIFCQNIVFNVVSSVFLSKEERCDEQFRDFNNGRYINLETEVAADLTQNCTKKPSDLPPAKKHLNGLSSEELPVAPLEEFSKFKSEGRKNLRNAPNSKESGTYNFFHTDQKKEKSRERDTAVGQAHSNNKTLLANTGKNKNDALPDLDDQEEYGFKDSDGLNSESYNLLDSSSKNADSNQDLTALKNDQPHRDNRPNKE